MIIAGGIITNKSIGVVNKNPNAAEVAAAQQREADRQAKVDEIAAKLAAKHQAAQAAQTEPKKWSVPFR